MGRLNAALWCLIALALPPVAIGQITPDEPVTGSIAIGSKPGNPLLDMPAGQRLISPFGERPVFSPDGRRLAFISEPYGDAFELDIATGKIRNLTGHMAHRGFVRVHYLHDGSFLLLGPRVPGKTSLETRSRIELFWMSAQADMALVPLGVTVHEGIATSRRSNRIAWGQSQPAGAVARQIKSVDMKQADVIVTGRTARLTNVRSIATIDECLVEAQDFLPGDTGLTMPCTRPSADRPGGWTSEVLSIDFATRKITRYPTPAEMYGEVEGIFPDGKRTMVECASDRSAGMDLCILELKSDQPRYVRLTHIQDYGRWKFGNPVVSPDGRTVAASIGPGDAPETTIAAGIVLIDLTRR